MMATVWLHSAERRYEQPRRVDIDFGPTASVPNRFFHEGVYWEKLVGRGSPEEPHFEEVRR